MPRKGHLSPDVMYTSVCLSRRERKRKCGSRGDVGSLSHCQVCLCFPDGGDTGATGGTRTALHLQLAGMLVHREFFQIHKTSRRGGESAKAKREGGRSKSGQAKRRPEQRRQRCPQGLSRPAPSHTACARAGPSRPPSLPPGLLSFLPS